MLVGLKCFKIFKTSTIDENGWNGKSNWTMDEIHTRNLTPFREIAISSSSSIYLTFF
jgi:hypothetical protein